MPTWADLQSRNQTLRNSSIRTVGDEVLVADIRGRMSPGNFVEEKLRLALAIEKPRRRRKPK